MTLSKFIKFSFVFVLLAFSVPYTVEIDAQMDYMGDLTQIQTFLSVEANVSDDDGSWRIARSNVNMFDMQNFRLDLHNSRASADQDYGEVGSSDYSPIDLVDLPEEYAKKEFSDTNDSIDYSFVIDGANSSKTALHILLFDVVTPNTGINSNVSIGFSNSSAGTVHATGPIYSDVLRATQTSVYFKLQGYMTVGSFKQYYARSINTTNLEYSSIWVFESNELFTDASKFDATISDLQYDASTGNLTSIKTERERMVNTILKTPARVTAPREMDYFEIGGFRNLDDTLKNALGVASDEQYNLTDFKIRMNIPAMINQMILDRFQNVIASAGDNEQGWQTAVNNIRQNFLKFLGFGTLEDPGLLAQNRYLDEGPEGTVSSTTTTKPNSIKDYGDTANQALAAAAEQSEDTDGTTRDKRALATELILDLLENRKQVKEDCDQIVCNVRHLPDIQLDGPIVYDEETGTYQAREEGFVFMNSLKSLPESNNTYVWVAVGIVSIAALVLLMRRRNSSKSMNEMSF